MLECAQQVDGRQWTTMDNSAGRLDQMQMSALAIITAIAINSTRDQQVRFDLRPLASTLLSASSHIVHLLSVAVDQS